ncbi:P-loop ATPase, Sll1717 family [Actinomadura citrea]|uniref:P-loop ATPase, Sll1717 family n=1 Tax=Actinomadura citrea TaxID=46158 RepID=UPI003CE551FE
MTVRVGGICQMETGMARHGATPMLGWTGVLVDGRLADLYFGRDDAETDIAEGGLLRAGFLRTATYEAARKARKHLIIGRKGSGKSAICRTLAAEQSSEVTTVLVTPDALSADEIRRFELQGIPHEMAKKLIWRYVLATHIARHLVAHAAEAHGKAGRRSVSTVRNFLAANGELGDQRPRFWQIIERLRTSLSLEAFGVGITWELGGPSEGIRTANQLDVVERNLKQAIKDLACPAEHGRLLLLVDQIEDVWSNDGESDSLVIGLLRAARDVTSSFSGVSCVVFLRSDIYDLLQFPDKDKLHGDEMRVDWSESRLLELILARAQASLGVDIDTDRLWSEIFPPRMNGTPVGAYLVQHTLLRPRDIIHLCNLCRDIAEGNGHDRITERDLSEAVHQYSDWKLNDLANEYLANYPFLDGLYPIFRDHGYVVTRHAFKRRAAEPLRALAGRFPERASGLTGDDVIDVLYEIGFLGVRRNDHVVYAHDHHDRIESTDREFHIHPCFRPALRATLATSKPRYDGVLIGEMVGRDVYAGTRNIGLQRGDREFQTLQTVIDGVRRLLDRLDDAGLPAEVRVDVSANLRHILEQAETLYGSPGGIAFGIDHIQAFLSSYAQRLENDGFADGPRTSAYIRSMDDLTRRVRNQVWTPNRGGYGGSGSEG